MILKNGALSKQGSRQGTYQINQIVNGKISWTSTSQAIWYLPAYNSWCIGQLDWLGDNICGITSWNGQGDKTPDKVPSEKWSYWDDGWKSTQSGDVVINCVSGRI